MAVLAVWAGFRARKGFKENRADEFIASAVDLARYEALSALPNLSDRRGLMEGIESVMERRVTKKESALREQALKAARVHRSASVKEAQAADEIASLLPERGRRAAEQQEASRELDRLLATLPAPPPSEPPTEDELVDEQADAEPLYRPRWYSKLLQRAVEVGIDFANFYPLLAAAGIGSELLGVTGSRAIVFVMAIAASLALPIGANRLGEMTIEGGVPDPRRSFLAWWAFVVLLLVPILIGGARALQLGDAEYGTFAGSNGVFAVSLVMLGIVVLEFAQGRRAAQATIVRARRAVAARQRRERRNPPPDPRPPAVDAAEERKSEADERLRECEADIAAARMRANSAAEQRHAASLALRNVHEEAKQMVRAEHSLAREAASRALSARNACITRYGPSHLAEEPPDRVLIEQLPMPPVFDPYALLDELVREEP